MSAVYVRRAIGCAWREPRFAPGDVVSIPAHVCWSRRVAAHSAENVVIHRRIVAASSNIGGKLAVMVVAFLLTQFILHHVGEAQYGIWALILLERFRSGDLVRRVALGRRFDLVILLEAAEHLPADSADCFIYTLVGLAPVVVFSAAVPGQVKVRWDE